LAFIKEQKEIEKKEREKEQKQKEISHWWKRQIEEQGNIKKAIRDRKAMEEEGKCLAPNAKGRKWQYRGYVKKGSQIKSEGSMQGQNIKDSSSSKELVVGRGNIESSDSISKMFGGNRAPAEYMTVEEIQNAIQCRVPFRKFPFSSDQKPVVRASCKEKINKDGTKYFEAVIDDSNCPLAPYNECGVCWKRLVSSKKRVCHPAKRDKDSANHDSTNKRDITDSAEENAWKNNHEAGNVIRWSKEESSGEKEGDEKNEGSEEEDSEDSAACWHRQFSENGFQYRFKEDRLDNNQGGNLIFAKFGSLIRTVNREGIDRQIEQQVVHCSNPACGAMFHKTCREKWSRIGAMHFSSEGHSNKGNLCPRCFKETGEETGEFPVVGGFGYERSQPLKLGYHKAFENVLKEAGLRGLQFKEESKDELMRVSTDDSNDAVDVTRFLECHPHYDYVRNAWQSVKEVSRSVSQSASHSKDSNEGSEAEVESEESGSQSGNINEESESESRSDNSEFKNSESPSISESAESSPESGDDKEDNNEDSPEDNSEDVNNQEGEPGNSHSFNHSEDIHNNTKLQDNTKLQLIHPVKLRITSVLPSSGSITSIVAHVVMPESSKGPKAKNSAGSIKTQPQIVEMPQIEMPQIQYVRPHPAQAACVRKPVGEILEPHLRILKSWLSGSDDGSEWVGDSEDVAKDEELAAESRKSLMTVLELVEESLDDIEVKEAFARAFERDNREDNREDDNGEDDNGEDDFWTRTYAPKLTVKTLEHMRRSSRLRPRLVSVLVMWYRQLEDDSTTDGSICGLGLPGDEIESFVDTAKHKTLKALVL
jgi:hypothetical protein